MDISKFIKNSELKIKNTDFDVDGLLSEAREGYVPTADLEKKIDEAVKAQKSGITKEYSELQTKYGEIEKQNKDYAEKIHGLELGKKIAEKGFSSEHADKVAALRSTMYSDETDDDKALDRIAEDFKGTFMPGKTIPEEQGESGTKDEKTKITRKTKISDLRLK